MNKESVLYRFVHTAALIAAACLISETRVFGLYYALADLAMAATANPPAPVVFAFALALFAALAALALLFTVPFNRKAAVALVRGGARPGGKRRWYAWAALCAAAAAMVLFLQFGMPYVEILDAMELRLGVVFLCLPFLWEYALGFGARHAPAQPAPLSKPAPAGTRTAHTA